MLADGARLGSALVHSTSLGIALPDGLLSLGAPVVRMGVLEHHIRASRGGVEVTPSLWGCGPGSAAVMPYGLRSHPATIWSTLVPANWSSYMVVAAGVESLS